MQRRSVALGVAIGLLSAMLAVPAVGAAAPTRCQVSNDRTRVGAGSLQAAVNAAAPGDTITIRGTCVGSTTIDRSLTLKGGRSNPAFGMPTLDGGGVGRVLFVDYFDPSRAGFTLTIEGLTITNGFGEDGNGGGGLLIQGGTVVITDSIITKNHSGVLAGGGIQAGGGTLSLANTLVSDNTAGDGGGGVWAGGTLTIEDSTVGGNTALPGAGGGVFAVGTLTIKDSTISGNRAYAGGGLFNLRGIASLSNVKVTGNAAYSGGGIENYSFPSEPVASMTITDSSISGNSSTYGGGVSDRGTARLAFGVPISTVGDNHATDSGGGVYLALGYGGEITGGCPTSVGGNVVYSPANTPTDYAGFACPDQHNEDATHAIELNVGPYYMAQTFTAGQTGALDSVELRLEHLGLVTNVANVRIATVASGIPTGTVIATAPPVTVTAADWVKFSFATPPVVTAGAMYAIVLLGPTPPWQYSDLDPYPNGQVVMGSGSGGMAYPSWDFTFRTYVRPM